MRCAVVGASVRVAYCVGELMFNVIRAEAQDFIQDGSRHRPESVAAHFVFADPHAAHG